MAGYDSSVEQEKKKRSCRRTTGTKSNQDTSTPIYHRRRISKAKHTIKGQNVHRERSDCLSDSGMNDHKGKVPLRQNSREYETERSQNLSDQNNSKNQEVQESDIGVTSMRRRKKRVSKDTLRIANEYNKLEKHYESAQEECLKLSNLLERRELEYREVCSRYEALINMVQELEGSKVDLAKQNQKLETKNVQSNEDIALLKSIVYQLNTQLERYQDRLRDQKHGSISTRSEYNEGKYDRSVWTGVNFHALGPLLNAYEENLTEKQNLVTMYEQEMADFGSRCKEILTENELMHKEVEELRLECNRYEKEIKTLVENTALLKKQNDLLKKEAIETKREANEIHSSYELKMEIFLKRNETLKKEHASIGAELSNLRGKYETLSKEHEQMRNKEEQTVPVLVHTSAIDECKTLLDELKYQYENEKRNLCNHIKRIEENQPENEKQLIMVIAERNHLKGLVESLESNLKRTQCKIERMQNLVYSTRASRSSLKGQLSKATAYCGELFSEYERIVSEREKLLTLLRETEKENANMDRVGKSISNRMGALKNQLEIVQKGAKQQVDSVEKRIKLQELQVRRIKRDYRCKIQHLSDVIKHKEDVIEKLQKEKHSDQNNSAKQVSQPVKDEKSSKR